MKPSHATTLLFTAAFALAGCTETLTLECTSTGPTEFAGETLTVLDHGAFGSYAEIEPLFENLTGASLNQIEGDDAGTALRQAIDSKGNPVADVLYGVDNALFAEGARAGIFEPYASPNLSRLALPRAQLDNFRHDGELLATPIDFGFIAVNYDRKLLDDYNASQLPTNLSDLAEEQWASEFVVEDPRFSSPGLGFLAATVATFGEDDDYDYLDYWKDLFDGGVLVVADWTTAYVVHFSAGYGQYSEGFIGDRSFVVSYTTSPAIEAYFGGLSEPPSVSLEPAKGVFRQIEAMAILKCTKQLPLAKAFIDFALSPAFQNTTMPSMAVYPVIEGVEIPQTIRDLATAPEDLVPAPFTSAELSQKVPKWIEAWRSLYLAEQA